jgi:hypothetical protein
VYRKEGHWFDAEKMEWVGMGRSYRGGKSRRYDRDEEQTENTKKKAVGRENANAKNNSRDEVKDDHLKPRNGGAVRRPRGSGDGLLITVWRLFVGV